MIRIGCIFLPQIVLVDQLHSTIVSAVFECFRLWLIAQIDFPTVSRVIDASGVFADFHFGRIADHIQISRITFHMNVITIANDAQMDFIIVHCETFAICYVFTFFHRFSIGCSAAAVFVHSTELICGWINHILVL